MAQTIRAGPSPRPRGPTPRRAPGPLFPPVSSSRSKPSPVSCPTAWDCLCPGFPSRTSGKKCWRKVWSPRSAEPPSGAGSAGTRSARGAIVRGSFPATPASPKAGPILDLYQGLWEGQRLGPGDFVLSADEKTSIQARRRIHASLPPASGRPALVEHEYERRGGWAYLAAWDVRRAKIFGRCETSTGIAPFDRLVEDVMGQEPYRSARRVFWIFDNGSSHRGQKAVQRLQSRWSSIIPVHTPVHASWLNQVEIYFSIIQRKVLTPSDFSCLADLEAALLAFQYRYEKSAAPFRWTFTRADLATLMQRLKASALPAAA